MVTAGCPKPAAGSDFGVDSSVFSARGVFAVCFLSGLWLVRRWPLRTDDNERGWQLILLTNGLT